MSDTQTILNNKLPKYYRTEAIAEIFGVSPKTIQLWHETGIFPPEASFRIEGSKIRFYILDEVLKVVDRARAQEMAKF